MKIVGRKKLDDFSRKHADTRKWIQSWIADNENAEWKTPQDIKERYASASFLLDNIVIFNVKGNAYRLTTQIAYNTGIILIKQIEKHTDYSKRSI